MWLFIFKNVNVSVEYYLFVFGTFHCVFLNQSQFRTRIWKKKISTKWTRQ